MQPHCIKLLGVSLSYLQHLQRMHNYCTLLSVLNGLAHPSITRLKKSFSKLEKTATKKMDELQALASPRDNFKLLREELKSASNPCIPYLWGKLLSHCITLVKQDFTSPPLYDEILAQGSNIRWMIADVWLAPCSQEFLLSSFWLLYRMQKWKGEDMAHFRGSGMNKLVSVQVLQFWSGKLTAHSGCVNYVGDSSPFVYLGRLWSPSKNMVEDLGTLPAQCPSFFC